MRKLTISPRIASVGDFRMNRRAPIKTFSNLCFLTKGSQSFKAQVKWPCLASFQLLQANSIEACGEDDIDMELTKIFQTFDVPFVEFESGQLACCGEEGSWQ